MQDEEFTNLKKTFFKIVFFILLFMIPFTIALVTKFGYNATDIENSIKTEEKVLIFVTEKNCTRCQEVNKILKDNNISYYELNIDKTSLTDYMSILRRIKMNENDIKAPTIIYVENGKLKSSLVDIKDKTELFSYLENNV